MGEDAKPRLIIADVNPLVVGALGELFDRDGRFWVAETGTSGAGVLAALTEKRGDVAVVGWRLADMTAADILQALRMSHAHTRLAVLSSEHNPSILRRCIQLGVMGFCWQSDDPSILVETAFAVHKNRISLPFIDMGRLGDSPIESLTPRERDLLKALSDGWSNVQIAARYGISENTVKYHLKNVYDKLGVKNRAMAITMYHTDRDNRR